MSDEKFTVQGLWFADEVGALCEQLFGVRCECTTADGVVVIHPRPRALSEAELAQLRTALSEVRPSAAERMAEEEAKLTARQATIEQLRQKAKEGKITAADLNDVVLAVLGEVSNVGSVREVLTETEYGR